jgi:hypothetical protein
MSFQANCFFELEILCVWAEIPCFPCSFPEQGVHAKPLILLCDQARQRPETGASGVIFEDSLLNSLLAGNCGRRNHGFPRPLPPH